MVRRLFLAERLAEEALRGPDLLSVVRSRMARNYGYASSRKEAFHLAKRDVWLLTREIERMVRDEGIPPEEAAAPDRPVEEPPRREGTTGHRR